MPNHSREGKKALSFIQGNRSIKKYNLYVNTGGYTGTKEALWIVIMETV